MDFVVSNIGEELAYRVEYRSMGGGGLLRTKNVEAGNHILKVRYGSVCINTTGLYTHRPVYMSASHQCTRENTHALELGWGKCYL